MTMATPDYASLALPELDTFDSFRGVISMIEVPRDSGAVLSELTNGFAEVLLLMRLRHYSQSRLSTV
jgi:hypothetical protein